MLGLITKGISKVFGSKSERDIKLVMPYVEKVKEIYPTLHDISDDDLRIKTRKLRDRITVRAGISEANAKALALQSSGAIRFMGGKMPRKVIYIPGRLVNIVV